MMSYTHFSLKRRAEQQMQKASNMADSEVIDPADDDLALLFHRIRSKVILSDCLQVSEYLS